METVGELSGEPLSRGRHCEKDEMISVMVMTVAILFIAPWMGVR